jgi:Transposase DDE domain
LIQVQGLTNHQLKQLAIDSGFMKRKSRKISAVDLLALMCLESQKGSPSYNDLAARFDALYNISPSKQAVWKRINSSCVLFFQSALALLIKLKVTDQEREAVKACGKYNRVIIQDSTIIKLPLSLFNQFSGVSNGHHQVCNARIQGSYDLLSGCFLSFSIDPYSKNDLKAAPDLELRDKDLVLRDRGYFSPAEIARQVTAGADFIFRYKCRLQYLDPVSKKPINIIALLKKHQYLDIDVCLNNVEQTMVRLVAAPVSQTVANNRRMKAKKEVHGRDPSAEVLRLMGWTIFLTTIPRSEADFNKISKIYRLRWQIEIIFKTWKSHLHFDEIHHVSSNQLQILLTARLTMIVLCMHKLFVPLSEKIYYQHNRNLSMLKFMSYFMKNQQQVLPLLISLFQDHNDPNSKVYSKLIRYCCYDKRKRLNMTQLAAEVLLS